MQLPWAYALQNPHSCLIIPLVRINPGKNTGGLAGPFVRERRGWDRPAGGSAMNLKLCYDAEFDLLHWGQAGIEDAAVEVYPGVTLELDAAGAIIGVEVFNAGQLLGPDFQPLLQAAARNSLSLLEYPAALASLLQPDGQGGYREYLDQPPAYPAILRYLRQALESLRQKFPAETQLPA